MRLSNEYALEVTTTHEDKIQVMYNRCLMEYDDGVGI